VPLAVSVTEYDSPGSRLCESNSAGPDCERIRCRSSSALRNPSGRNVSPGRCGSNGPTVGEVVRSREIGVSGPAGPSASKNREKRLPPSQLSTASPYGGTSVTGGVEARSLQWMESVVLTGPYCG